MCAGPFNSFCGRYHTTLDYIFVPNCLLYITSAKTFEADPDNTYSIQLTLTINYNFASCAGNSQCSKKKPKIKWSKFSLEVINTQYVTPLLYDLENGDGNGINENYRLKRRAYTISSYGIFSVNLKP